MGFWKRATKAVTDTISAPEKTPEPVQVDPDAWRPDYAYEPQTETKHLMRGPFRMDEESALMDAYIIHANDTLRKHGIHADQVDGGLAFSRVPIAERNASNECSVNLRQIINGLGFSYGTDTYPHAGFRVDADGLPQPHFDIVREPRPSDDYYGLYGYWAYHYRSTIFHLTHLNDLDAGIPKRLEGIGESLVKEHVPVTPTTLMARLVLDTFSMQRLTPELVTGVLLPTRTSLSGYGSSKKEDQTPYIPQLYWEYLRCEMPISFLLAAVLPIHHMPEGSRWYPSASGSEHTPRFKLTDVYSMRDAPIGLALEMVGATRAQLVSGVNIPF